MIALTADAMSGVREKVLASGFDEYLTKPCAPKDIVSTIKKYLEQKIILS
jgi:CheY-like chemotaxis protein